MDPNDDVSASVNGALVRRGYARVRETGSDSSEAAILRGLEEGARGRKVGLYRDCTGTPESEGSVFEAAAADDDRWEITAPERRAIGSKIAAAPKAEKCLTKLCQTACSDFATYEDALTW